MPMLALVSSTCGRTVEKAVVRCSRVVCERGACVSDWESDELHPSPLFLEGHDEGGVFLCLLRELDVAAEIFAEADLDDGEGALFLVEGGRV